MIGILKGQFFGTANDEVIVLGAHLDTQGLQQYGVNNDGSGLTALLTLAEDLTGKFYKMFNCITRSITKCLNLIGS